MSNWDSVEFIFAFKLNINPLVLRELEFYSIQQILKKYEEHIDRENKENEKQQREMEKQQKLMGSSSYGNLSIPKIEIPKLDIPKY